MPDFTMPSAMLLIRSSLTLQANLFQLFHPMGGVRARFAEGAEFCAQSGMEKIRPKHASRRFLASAMIQSPRTLKFVLDPKGPARCAHEEARRFPLIGCPIQAPLGWGFLCELRDRSLRSLRFKILGRPSDPATLCSPHPELLHPLPHALNP